MRQMINGLLTILAVLTILLFVIGEAASQLEMRLDWSNGVAYEMTQEEIEALQGYDMYVYGALSLFTEKGWENAQAIGGPILATVNLLHCNLPERYESSPWPWVQAEGGLFSGTHALNVEGQPSIRWYDASGDSLKHRYHVDARLADPYAYANLIVQWCQQYPVDGIFFDYLAEKPWTYKNDHVLEPSAYGGDWWKWHQYIVIAMVRQAMGPDFVLIANGRHAMEQAWLVHPNFLSGVWWERCGTLWWDVPTFLAMAKGRTGIQIYGGRRGAKAGDWDMGSVAEMMALLEGQYVTRGKPFPAPK